MRRLAHLRVVVYMELSLWSLRAPHFLQVPRVLGPRDERSTNTCAPDFERGQRLDESELGGGVVAPALEADVVRVTMTFLSCERADQAVWTGAQ